MRARISFRLKLALSYLFSTAIPLLMVAALSYASIESFLRRDAITIVSQQLDGIARSLTDAFNGMMSAYQLTNTQNELIAYLLRNDEAQTPYERTQSSRRTDELLNGLQRAFSLAGLRLYLNQAVRTSELSETMLPLSALTQLPAAVQSRIDSLYVVWHPPYLSTLSVNLGPEVLALSGPLVTESYGETLGYVFVEKRVDAFRPLLEDAASHYGGRTAILAADGAIIIGGSADDNQTFLDPSLLERAIRAPVSIEGTAGGGRETLIARRLPTNGWILTATVPERYFALRSLELTRFIIGGFSFAAIIAFAMIFLFSRSISGRIGKLIATIERNAAGGDVVLTRIASAADGGGGDEIDSLYATYDAMAERINGLIETVYKERLASTQSHLEALQAHINPHFLYNALGSIHDCIELEDTALARRIIASLSGFFRIALSKGSETIPLHAEFDMVENYLEIQSALYGSSFAYTLSLDESIRGIAIVRFTLQPIVENALLHGLRDSGRPGMLTLSARSEGSDALIEIRDNGVGIPAERLRELERLLASAAGERGDAFGLTNVQTRLRLHYGARYGVSVQSEPEIGTTVVVRVPKEGSSCAAS